MRNASPTPEATPFGVAVDPVGRGAHGRQDILSTVGRKVRQCALKDHRIAPVPVQTYFAAGTARSTVLRKSESAKPAAPFGRAESDAAEQHEEASREGFSS